MNKLNLGGIGPGGKDEWKIKPSTVFFLNKCNKYINELTTWKKFVIWRYTLGSGSLNKFLIGLPMSNTTQYWIFTTCKLFKGLKSLELYRYLQLPYSFKKYSDWFINPSHALNQNNYDEFFKLFAIEVNEIILNSPKVIEPFEVIKVTAKYPELPDPQNFRPKKVLQNPFNSTTLDIEMNFGLFMSEESIIIKLTIPKGANVLFVGEIHAYPFEYEIILPLFCAFDLKYQTQEIVNYFDDNTTYFRQIQEFPYALGPVYQLDSSSRAPEKTKKMYIMSGKYIQP